MLPHKLAHLTTSAKDFNFLAEVRGGVDPRPSIRRGRLDRCWCGGSRRQYPNIASPDQDFAIPISGHLLGVGELDLETTAGKVSEKDVAWKLRAA